MTSDAFSRLEAAIAASAADRDKKDQISRDEQAAKVRQQERARAIWAIRREQLPGAISIVPSSNSGTARIVPRRSFCARLRAANSPARSAPSTAMLVRRSCSLKTSRKIDWRKPWLMPLWNA
jgi:hypothetical protein